MNKSKEQILKELGVDKPGYWFTFNDDQYQRMWYWSSKENVRSLQERMTKSAKTISGWRRSQTDWRSVNGLVLYDRFGSKITMSERPEEIEVKLTDAGKDHWDAFTHYEILDSYYYVKDVFETWGGSTKMAELREELTRLYRLFPANEAA